jgi:hypothetical protein
MLRMGSIKSVSDLAHRNSPDGQRSTRQAIATSYPAAVADRSSSTSARYSNRMEISCSLICQAWYDPMFRHGSLCPCIPLPANPMVDEGEIPVSLHYLRQTVGDR